MAEKKYLHWIGWKKKKKKKKSKIWALINKKLLIGYKLSAR